MKVSVINILICFVQYLNESSIQVLNKTKGLAWLLEPQALGKLITYDICSSIKQNLSHTCVLRPNASGKLMTYGIYSSIK